MMEGLHIVLGAGDMMYLTQNLAVEFSNNLIEGQTILDAYFNSTTAQSLACPYDQTFKVIYAYKAQEDTLYSYAANVKGYSEGELFTHNLGESFSVKTVPFDKVKKLIDHGDYCIYIKNGLTTAVKELIVEKVDITYLDRVDSATEKHIQPCYRLTGSLITDNLVSEFTIFIRAVPDEYTYE